MAKRVLFDTNVIIDVLANRRPFVAQSSAVWNAHQAGIVDGYVAAVSLTNFFYIVQIACAYAYQLDSIVTRDQLGFMGASIPAMSPAQLLEQIQANGDET